MKTAHCQPFVSGLMESVTKPFGKDVLAYQDKFYVMSNQRIPYKRDKTEDNRFFIRTLFGIAQEFVNDLVNRFREQMIDLRSGTVVFMGGGAILLRRQIKISGKVGNAIFVEDINANAKGYDF